MLPATVVAGAVVDTSLECSWHQVFLFQETDAVTALVEVEWPIRPLKGMGGGGEWPLRPLEGGQGVRHGSELPTAWEVLLSRRLE